MRAKQHQLATVLVSWCLVHGAFSALTGFPRNVIIKKGEDVYMECSTDAPQGINTINWRYDAAVVIQVPCTSSDISRFNVSTSTTNDCFIIGHSNPVSGNQGPYHCSDGSTLQAEAVALLIDPEPTCGVVGPPIRGQNVNLSCVVSYHRMGEERRVNPGANMTASVSWDSGTVLSSSSTPLPNDVGETLQVDVVQEQVGDEIPSYTCTASFTFTDTPSLDFVYALNDLSTTCVTEPVRTWYCPSSATVTPSSGPFETGNVLTCDADGYPLFYKWTDSNDNVVSTSSTVTILNPGEFTLTCTAYGNFSTDDCEFTDSVSGTATGDPVTTVSSVTGDGSGGNVTDGNGGDGTGDDGSALSTGAIAGIAAALGLLAIGALLLGIWLYRRRKKDDGRPRSVAFYQAVRAGRPAKLGCRGKENPMWMMEAYRPRSIDHQVYGNYCGLGNCYSPRYSQQSVPMSPVFH